MDADNVEVVCPGCAARIESRVAGRDLRCPRCGRVLSAVQGTVVKGAATGEVDMRAMNTGTDAEDDALIDDLRDAFGFSSDAAGLPEEGATQIRSPGSDAFDELVSAAAPPLRRLGDFEILEELGRGGMGVVYRARQISLSREVALKVLPGYARRNRAAVQRFRAEARAAARIHHTNVVPIYAQGEHEGHFYYAMELVDGVGLDTIIHSRPDLLSSTRARGRSSSDRSEGFELPPTRRPARPDGAEADAASSVRWTRDDYRHIASLVAEVAEGLECAHRTGVIHRDVKPHNLLLSPENRLHLTDFGLARLTDEAHLTVSGEVMGTPAYLSPEQVRGQVGRIDHRTDIYSLGVTLYEMITRRRPFEGETREQIMSGICDSEPVPPRRVDPRIPVDIETICLRAMEKQPARRHPSAAALADDLRRFAEGRPILSRRVTRVEKALKWVRRHKALSAAIAAALLAVLLGGGWGWSAVSARERAAEQLLQSSYEELAYFDYLSGERVMVDIDRAESLGADPDRVRVVRGLALIGALRWPEAIQLLEESIQADPDNLLPRYLLAWVQWEKGERTASQQTFAEADQRGPPAAADVWLFRGLARHFDDPHVAIESYRKANALRAGARAFYPLAMLQLARVRNQQLYATRSLDGFDEATGSLRQLIEHGHYGARPHYLLSIAHRLAAEIYRGSRGTRGDGIVEEHYAEALRWAELGQELDPADSRPITAEAECLESLGRYAEALDARTRVLSIESKGFHRWQAHHYRWRLHYWIGRHEEALEDLAACAGYDPGNLFYEHVYPALVRAEMGELPSALEHARAVVQMEPDSAVHTIWSATCLRLLGAAEEAAALLDERADDLDFGSGLVRPESPEWIRALYGYCRGGVALEELESLAQQAAAPWKLWGQAYFHAAAVALAEGDRDAAGDLLLRAYQSFDDEQRYTYHARLLLVKMRKDPAWPAWGALSWGRQTGVSRLRALADGLRRSLPEGGGER